MTPLTLDRPADVVAHAPVATARPRVVVVLPRGEAIRNFVYTGALDQLANHADITLLTVLPTAQYADECRQKFSDVIELAERPERWIVRIHREVLEMSHGRWLWSEAAKERWRLRDREAVTPSAWLKRTGKKFACYPFANRRGLEVVSAAERRVSRWFNPSDEYIRLYRETKPALVFNGSHVHSRVAIQAVQSAQWLGIPTAAFVFSWDNLTSQGRMLPPYDHYLVWNEAIRQQLLDIYPSVTPEQVRVTGTPQFDFHFRREYHWTRDEFCRRVGADPDRPIVLYSTGMPNHMPGEPKIVEGLAALLRQMGGIGRPQLMVRVYPKDRTGRFEPLKATCPDVLFPEIPWDPAYLTPRPEDAHLLTNMLRHAAAGVNVASTISLELCMFGRPVVNVAYNPEGVDPAALDYAHYYEFDHYKTLVRAGAVSLARSEVELGRLLHEALTNPAPAVARGHAFIEAMFGSTLDGHSADRVANALLEIGGVRDR